MTLKNELYNKWWSENWEELKAQKEILQAGNYFLCQQAYWAGYEEGRYSELNRRWRFDEYGEGL